MTERRAAQVDELSILGISEMAGTSLTYRGLVVPEWFDLVFAATREHPPVTIRARMNVETGPVPVGVILVENPPTRTYRDAVEQLKGVPLDDVLHRGMLMASGAWAWQQGKRDMGFPADVPLSRDQEQVLDQRVSAVHRQAESLPAPRRRRSTTPALLKDVAAVYRKAVSEGHPPTVAVADHFNASHRSAARWVSLARRDGFLGPAQGTKAGEATPSE